MKTMSEKMLNDLNRLPDILVTCDSLSMFFSTAVHKRATDINRYKGRAAIDGKVYQFVLDKYLDRFKDIPIEKW